MIIKLLAYGRDASGDIQPNGSVVGAAMDSIGDLNRPEMALEIKDGVILIPERTVSVNACGGASTNRSRHSASMMSAALRCFPDSFASVMPSRAINDTRRYCCIGARSVPTAMNRQSRASGANLEMFTCDSIGNETLALAIVTTSSSST